MISAAAMSDLVAQYSERFGVLVPMAFLQSVPREKVVAQILNALETGTPVEAWASKDWSSPYPLPLKRSRQSVEWSLHPSDIEADMLDQFGFSTR